MKRYFSLLSVVLTLLCLKPALCQEPQVFEGAIATGYISYQGHEYGVMLTLEGTRLVYRGLKLGDFRIVSLALDGPFVMEAEGEEYLVEWEGEPQEAEVNPDNPRVRFENTNAAYSAQALARVLDLNFYCDTEFVGDFSCQGTPSVPDLLEQLALSGEQYWKESSSLEVDFQAVAVDGSLIVGPPAKVEAVSHVLRQGSNADKRVSIDFVNAELYYVLDLLAKELGLEIERSGVHGGVTITAKNVSAARLLEAALALQEETYQAKWSDKKVEISR